MRAARWRCLRVTRPGLAMIGICHGAAHVSYLLSDLAAVPVRACEQVSELELQGWGWLAQRLSRVFGAVQSLDRNSADKGSLRRYNSSHEAHSLAPPPSTAPCVRCSCYADVWRAPICGARGTSDALAAHTWCKSGGLCVDPHCLGQRSRQDLAVSGHRMPRSRRQRSACSRRVCLRRYVPQMLRIPSDLPLDLRISVMLPRMFKNTDYGAFLAGV